MDEQDHHDPGVPVTLSPGALEEAVVVVKAMGSVPRAQILAALASQQDGEYCVGDITEMVDLSQSAASQHLAKLRAAKVVKTRRDRQVIYYSLADERVREILRQLA